jgi:hypothetical protein
LPATGEDPDANANYSSSTVTQSALAKTKAAGKSSRLKAFAGLLRRKSSGVQFTAGHLATLGTRLRAAEKVYAKRAAIRGQQPITFNSSQSFQDWPTDSETDEYSY